MDECTECIWESVVVNKHSGPALLSGGGGQSFLALLGWVQNCLKTASDHIWIFVNLK